MKEVRARLETLRPNRTVWVREWILGIAEKDDDMAPPPVVDLQLMMVHGSCGTEQQFHLMLLSLEAKVQALGRKGAIRCVLFDAVGCGKSPVLRDFGDYSSEELMEDLAVMVHKFIDASLPLVWGKCPLFFFCKCLPLYRPGLIVIIFFLSFRHTVAVGHSYGPSLILRLLANPNNSLSEYQTAGLILVGTAVRPVPNDPSFFPDGGLPIFFLPVWILWCLQYFMTLQFTRMAIHPKHQWLRQACMADSNSNSCFMIRSFYRQTKWATVDDLLAVAGTPTVPVLVVHGVDDGVIPLTYAQDLVNKVPKGTLCAVDEASHLVMIEQADNVATLTLDYLTKNFLK